MISRRLALAVLAAGLVLGTGSCSNGEGADIGAGTTSSVPAGAAAPGATGPSPTGSPSNTPSVKDVGTCASITAPDLTGLGVEGLAVDAVQDVTSVLQGQAQGGTGCWFSLTRGGGSSVGLTILSHPDGGSYFDSAVARLDGAEPIPGLGDDARVGADTPGSPTVITRRGARVIEVRIGRPDVLDRNLLIAVAGLALERED